MNTNAIRDVATNARRQLLEAVERRCLLYDIEEGAQREADTVNGRVLSSVERAQRRELLRIQEDLRTDGKPGSGHAALVEQAAYIWFNRLFAIRFMELNDRLPSHVRMLSAQDGSFAPDCLKEAMDLPLDALDREEVARLVAEGDDEGLFRVILIAQCAELAECMPAVFDRIGSAMELLLPDGLLVKDGIVESLVMGIPEDDWREGVEIVGWAYQFYVSERKDEVFAGFKKKQKAGKNEIAPATQLFTPEYIVRFLVQNSLGRLWALNNPDSPLANRMEYFVKPDPENHEEYRKVASPEDITLIDPACGSGHFLCYAFDLLAKMYEERGYRPRDIARLILEKNLTGIEIDRRASALTSFALTMKACELDGRFMRRGVAPRVTCLESVVLTPEEREAVGASVEQQALVDVLMHLGEAGSLWQPTKEDSKTIDAWLQQVQTNRGLFAGTAMEKLARAQEYVQVLGKTRLICATNPPYMGSGNLAPWMSTWVKSNYPDEKADLCTCFIARGFKLVSSDGYNAQVTMQSWMFLSSFEKMRQSIIGNKGIVCMAHLGARAFDAIGGEVVQTTASVLLNGNTKMKGTYFRLKNGQSESEKADGLKTALNDPDCSWRYAIDLEKFESIPGHPVAYWVSDALINAFGNTLLSNDCMTRKGLATSDNDRFIRLWFEVSRLRLTTTCTSNNESKSNGYRWFPHNKGGEYRRWYGNNYHVIDWENDGYGIRNFRDESGKLRSRPQNLELNFRRALTWSKISTGPFCARMCEGGSLFDDAAAICYHESRNHLCYVLGFLNTPVCSAAIEALNPTINVQIGDIGNLPIAKSDESEVARIVSRCINLSKDDWDAFETSWDFTTHPLVRGNRISSAYGFWSAECKDRFDTLRANEERINDIFAHIYHMESEVSVEVEDDKVSVRRADLGRDVRSLISYAVGCMFGRYSLDKPGLVLANQGDGLNEYLAQVPHPRYMPDEDGILPITDDEYFEDDIVAMFCEFLKAAYGPETLEENLQFVADALGGTGAPRKVIRDYFMSQFFADHCATYSVPSAGKRPIYWLVDSGKLGGFRALVYMHRYTPDLLARVRTDYVHERQERYRSRIAELEREREGASRREQSAIDRELKRLRAQLDEVTKFEERLHHLADQMIEIDLDDGFKVNYAKFADVMAKVK
jgi:type II restriction/modification system DNA methylase subunit YeeA